MVTIYCIEDCNSLKYVGSTKQKLCDRIAYHKFGKRKNTYLCSSSKLNLDHCIYYSLETCNESERSEREKYWIDKIDCVNIRKLNGGNKVKRNNYLKRYDTERNLFRSKKVVNGCYEFIKMLEQY